MNASLKKREVFHRKEIWISGVVASEEDNSALQPESMLDTLETAVEMSLPLPVSVHMCRQSIRQGRITVAHTLLVDLRIRDDVSGVVHHVRQIRHLVETTSINLCRAHIIFR